MKIKTEKELIRKQMAQKRNSLSQNELLKKSALIGEKLFSLNEFKAAKNILFYMSLEKEVQTWDMICYSHKLSKQIFLPLVLKNRHHLDIARLRNIETPFITGSFGVKEPEYGSYDLVEPKELDLIVAPGLAFDYQGGRLGFGKGYYDRLFANGSPNTLRFGVALDFQVISTLPQSKDDLPVHLVATEKRVILCNPNSLIGSI